MPAYDSSTLNYRGLTFTVAKHYDETMQAPWEEHDSHGIVTDWINSGDAPEDARELNRDRTRVRYYDLAASLERARADQWGLTDTDRAALALTLGRELTAEDVTAEAVRKDYEHLRAWCRDEWHYMGVVVTLRGTHISRSLWGIESTEHDYHEEVARELADEIIASAGKELRAERKRLAELQAKLTQADR